MNCTDVELSKGSVRLHLLASSAVVRVLRCLTLKLYGLLLDLGDSRQSFVTALSKVLVLSLLFTVRMYYLPWNGRVGDNYQKIRAKLKVLALHHLAEQMEWSGCWRPVICVMFPVLLGIPLVCQGLYFQSLRAELRGLSYITC